MGLSFREIIAKKYLPIHLALCSLDASLVMQKTLRAQKGLAPLRLRS